jgi:hypothetical protein
MKNKLNASATKLGLIVIVLIIGMLVLFGCSKSDNSVGNAPVKTPYAGKYVEKTQKDISIELVSNGTFTMKIRKDTIKGTYEANGTDLTFYPGQGIEANAKVEGDTVTFSQFKDYSVVIDKKTKKVVIDKKTKKAKIKTKTVQLVFVKQ